MFQSFILFPSNYLKCHAVSLEQHGAQFPGLCRMRFRCSYELFCGESFPYKITRSFKWNKVCVRNNKIVITCIVEFRHTWQWKTVPRCMRHGYYQCFECFKILCWYGRQGCRTDNSRWYVIDLLACNLLVAALFKSHQNSIPKLIL